METAFKHVQVVINPAAGNNEPILNTLNDVFKEYDLHWDVSITHKPGDGERLAKAAIDAGADLVAAYGGDGTQGEVARGMANTGVPMAVLPGGTANALAMGLGIPFDLPSAVRTIFTSRVEPIDLGEANGFTFILRADVGMSTRVAQQANRELKDRFGLLAYVLAGLQAFGQPELIKFSLTIDGEQIEAEGIACIVTNHNELGGLGLKFTPNVSASDGVLDAFVVKDTGSVLAAAANQLALGESDDVPPGLLHWRGKEFLVETEKPQDYSLDGDEHGQTPLTVRVMHHALHVLVPENSSVD